MSTPQAGPPPLIRFGVFELDSSTGELRKNGRRVRLQGQPFQILKQLAVRPGQVVTREELCKELWPDGTFVDFDHSLNTAINKIREVLGDSASSPRFVETVARRGYRLIASVEKIGKDGTAEPTVATESSRPVLHPQLQVPVPNRGVTRTLFGLIQFMYLVFYFAALFHLGAVIRVVDSYFPGREATVVFGLVLGSAGIGIPVRCYLLSAAAFDYRKLGTKFKRIFYFVLGLDGLWAVAPIFLVEKIGFGGSFAAMALLMYVPFAERTLLRMAYVE